MHKQIFYTFLAVTVSTLILFSMYKKQKIVTFFRPIYLMGVLDWIDRKIAKNEKRKAGQRNMNCPADFLYNFLFDAAVCICSRQFEYVKYFCESNDILLCKAERKRYI